MEVRSSLIYLLTKQKNWIYVQEKTYIFMQFFRRRLWHRCKRKLHSWQKYGCSNERKKNENSVKSRQIGKTNRLQWWNFGSNLSNNRDWNHSYLRNIDRNERLPANDWNSEKKTFFHSWYYGCIRDNAKALKKWCNIVNLRHFARYVSTIQNI